MDAVKIGVVGAGLVGKRHLEAISHLSKVKVAGVVEPHIDRADWASEYGCNLFASLEDLLAEGNPDGVIIATPTPLHVEQARKCILARCPTLIEKPIATNTQEAEALVGQAEVADVPILVGHHRRHNPLIQKAHEIIASGGIGTIRAVQGTCWFYKPDQYFDDAPWRKKVGAGPISVNLVHDIDLIRHFVGEVVSVQAQATKSMRGYDNEDVAAAVLKFDNGAICTITVSDSIAAPWSWEHTSKEYPIYPVTNESCYLIGGSEGSLSIPDLRVWRHDGKKPDWWTPIVAKAHSHAASDPLINQIKHFADVIGGIAEPLVSGREGLQTLKVIEAIQQAASSGKTLTL